MSVETSGKAAGHMPAQAPFFQLSGIQQASLPGSPGNSSFPLFNCLPDSCNAFSPHKPALCQVWPQEREMGVCVGGRLLDVT